MHVTAPDSISRRITGGVIEITLHRPADAVLLDRAQRKALTDALIDAQADTAVRAVMIRSEDGSLARHPDLGPDLPDPDDRLSPTLADLCREIEACRLPLGVVLDGPVVGVGAELALAARLRLASPRARIGFPAVRLGRITGAGATQRLPGLVGAQETLRLLTTGLVLSAAEARAIGLVDQVLDDDAPGLAALPNGPRLSVPPGQDGRAWLQAVQDTRQAAAMGSVQAALADCVEAALLLPRDQGLAFEAAAAIARDALPETAALAHLVQAARAASGTPEALARVTGTAVGCVTLVGARRGALSALARIVGMMLSRGVSVLVLEPDRDRLVGLLQAVAARQEAAVQAGKQSAAQRDAAWARLTPVNDPVAVDQADLVIVARDGEVPVARAGVPVLVMGGEDLPPGGFRLVLAGRVAELGVPAQAETQSAAQALAFLRRIGLTVVLTGPQSVSGISGQLAQAGDRALGALMAMGVAPGAIASALERFGMAAPTLPQTNPVAPRRTMDADQILGRWLGALANEGARLLDAGLARAAGDIDLVAVHALGMPASCGGPLHLADRRGLLLLRRDLQAWSHDDPIWTPVSALDALVSVGSFGGRFGR